MTDIEIDNIVKKLIESPLTSYVIAKKTCITEQTIGNYRKKLTRPTAANAKLLEYYFAEIEGQDTDTFEHSNDFLPHKESVSVGDDHVQSLIDILNRTLAEKDRQIDRLLSIIEKKNL